MTAKKDINRLARNLRRGIGIATSKKAMRGLGLEAIDIIVDRTRRGKGVRGTGKRQVKLKQLRPKYIAFRRTQKLDPTTRPAKSNLTFTGQMLRSMVVKSSSNRKVVWGPNRRRRKGGRGLTNEKLGEYVAEQGRPFNNLSAREITKIAKSLDKVLSRYLSKI